jgi:hypothetical protein
MPQSGEANGYLELIPTALPQFGQGQIRLGFNPPLQDAIVIRQPGTPVAADFFGQALTGLVVLPPKPLDAFTADPETLADFAGAFTPFTRSNDALPQILTQRSHSRSFLCPPP